MSVSKILLTCLDLYLFSFNNYGMSQNSFFAGFGIFRTSSRYLGPLSCWSPSWSASWWSSSSTTSRPGDLGSAKVFNDWQLIFAKVGASAQHNITSYCVELKNFLWNHFMKLDNLSTPHFPFCKELLLKILPHQQMQRKSNLVFVYFVLHFYSNR